VDAPQGKELNLLGETDWKEKRVKRSNLLTLQFLQLVC
jgi:hypothetical protein